MAVAILATSARLQAQSLTADSASVSALATDAHGYLVRWTESFTTETRFRIEAALASGGPYSEINEDFAPNSTYGHVYLSVFPANTTIYFRVIAYNGTTALATSNVVSATVPSSVVTNPPTNLGFSFPATDTLRLTWTDNSNQEDYVEVWVRDVAAGGGFFRLPRIVPFNLTSFDFYYYLQRGRTYEIKLNAVRYNGPYGTNVVNSGFSSSITVTAPGTAITTPPVSPANLSVAALIDASVRYYGIHWDDLSSDDTGFAIEQKRTTDSLFWSLGILPGPAGTNPGVGFDWNAGVNSSGQQVALAANDSYDFRIWAVRGFGPFAVYSSTPSASVTSVQADFGAPTNLRATAPADNGRVQLFWADNATGETGYEFEYKVGASGAFTPLPDGAIALLDFSRFQFLGNSLSFLGGLGFFPPSSLVTFRIRAVRTSGSPLQSAYSNEVSVTTPPLTTPTGLTVNVLSESSVKLDWVDNSGNEQGYLVQARFLPTGTFFTADTTAANAQTHTLTLPNLPYPGLGYEFRVIAAYQESQSNLIQSAPSNVVSANVPFNAASGVTATVVNETSVNLTWTDNSSVETKYEVLVKRPTDTQYAILATLAANTTSYSVTGRPPGTTLEYAVVAVYTRAINDEIDSPLSNVASATTPLNAPTVLAVQAGSVTEKQLVLTWTDNSLAEGGFEILSRTAGSGATPTQHALAAANATSATVAIPPGASLEFFVRAYYVRSTVSGDVALSSNSNGVTATAFDGFTSDLFQPCVTGASFLYQAATSNTSPRVSWVIAGLPAGLIFNNGNGQVTGTPTVSGLFACPMTAEFTNGHISNTTLTLRVIRNQASPAVGTAFANESLVVGGSTNVALAGRFTDLDTESALRLVTTKGNVDIILYQTQTPVTVANFLGYVNRADFAESAFHRISTLADSGVEVLQGGQFKVSAATAQSFTSITTLPAIANEAGISNQPYTVAMAKQGGDPNSATSQFYFNLNPANTSLDDPDLNGGFTVFGRVSLPTRATIDALKGFAGGPYSVTVDAQATTIPFKWPMNVASQAAVPAAMDNTKVMKIISAAPLTTLLTFAASSSNPAVATAAVSGGDVSVSALSAGETTVTVTATDLDGGQTSQQFTVTVNHTFATWAAQNSLPAAADEPLEDADGDGGTNLEEFAFFSNPVAGSDRGRPAPSQTGADPVGRITFKTRKFAPSLTYIVQASETLLNPDWTDIWNSATDGYGSPRVTVDQNNADHRVITITDVETIAATESRRFLRVKVVQAP